MKKGKIILISILVVALIGAGAVIYFLYTQNEQHKLESETYLNTIYSYNKTVYVALTDIKNGDLLQDGVNCEAQNIVSVLPETILDTDLYLDESDMGKKVVVDVKMGTPLYKNMVGDLSITPTTRKVELSTVSLPTTITNGDYVDIRIVFPNGEDYIVLSKKRVSDLFLEQCLFSSELEEDEILTLSSAIIDTFCISGTRMYLTTYVAPSYQQKLNETYLVRKETIDLITNSPNVIKQMAYTINMSLREEMEKRLSDVNEDTLTAVVNGWGIQDTATNAVLLGRADGEYDVSGSDVDASYIVTLNEDSLEDAKDDSTLDETYQREVNKKLNKKKD